MYVSNELRPDVINLFELVHWRSRFGVNPDDYQRKIERNILPLISLSCLVCDLNSNPTMFLNQF